jgi:hypothetical protein
MSDKLPHGLIECYNCKNKFDGYRRRIQKRYFCSVECYKPHRKASCKFPKGHTPWIKGKHHTIESRLKMGQANLGRKQTIEHIRKRVLSNAGYNHSDETKLKISLANSKFPHNKNKYTRKSEKKIKFPSLKRGLNQFHWNWRGGITTQNKAERLEFYKDIREIIFKRDKYKCQICDNGGNLQVDHIKSWSKYPELRFNIDNCRTLCTKCHYLITFKKILPQHITHWGHNQLKLT